jgi:hypothetical protein
MKEIETVVGKTGKISGFLLGETDYEQGYGNNVVEVLGDYITLFRPDSYFVNLSLADSLVKEGIFSREVEERIGENDFYTFIAEQKRNNTFSSIVESRQEFIEKFDIDYVIASPHVVLDSLMEKHVSRKIKDTYSGHVFLLLDKAHE